MSPNFTTLALSVSSPAVQTSITVPFAVLITAAPSVVPAYSRSVPMTSTEMTHREGMPEPPPPPPPPPPPVLQHSSRVIDACVSVAQFHMHAPLFVPA